jgi:hypothetical protein
MKKGKSYRVMVGGVFGSSSGFYAGAHVVGFMGSIFGPAGIAIGYWGGGIVGGLWGGVVGVGVGCDSNSIPEAAVKGILCGGIVGTCAVPGAVVLADFLVQRMSGIKESTVTESPCDI